MNIFKRTVQIMLVTLSLSSCSDNLLPSDMLQGESVVISANPKNLHTCVVLAIRGIDGVSIDETLYDAKYELVPLKTSMANVSGVVQKRVGGNVRIFIGVTSMHNEPEVQDFAGWRVKAIATGISKECSID